MAAATLESFEAGQWQLAGDLDFATVPVIWRKLSSLIIKDTTFSLSLADVASTNSAAMVMLLEAKQVAQTAGTQLHIQHVPHALMELFRLSNAEHLIEDVLA